MHLHSSAAAAAFLSLGLAATPQGCVVDVGGTKGEIVRVEKRFAVTGVPDLTLVTFDGSVEVRAWDRDELLVEIEKRGVDRSDAESIEVRAEQTGNKVTVEAVKPRRANVVVQFGISPSARLVATVPRRCNLVAKSGDGSVIIERLAGRVEVDTGDGSVRAVDIEGAIRLHTGDGAIRVTDLDGPADLDTGDGSVQLNGRLSTLRLRTGDGSVSVRAESGSAMGDDWEVRTGDGGITLELPDGFAANLDADAGDGRVRLEGESSDARSERRQRTLRTELNGGGKLLRVRTGDGSIVIKRL